MKIHKASESITYARLSRSENGKAPRFLLHPEADSENKKMDSVEISEMGRAEFLKKSALNRRLQRMAVSEEALNRARFLIKHSGGPETDAEKLSYIKARVAGGEYDFNEKDKLSILAEIAMS